MRTTVRIDDHLMRDLRERAHREGTSLAKLINRLLQQAMRATREESAPVPPFREKTFPMGEPRLNLDKAIGLAASLEDEEVREELARRK
jgi:hypothetical protein